ncbi:MAG: DNA polymerase ligase N-terminal domain-containing protein [Parcubacteria group bacterium]
MDKNKLKEYQNKRDFSKSSEPSGAKTKKKKYKDIFVIQKHDASNLHYDLRLEINGVLKSWAIPKGPSLDPSEKRLAVLTEDHPLDYASFEGKIPEDEYGGGTVIVWDQGRYVNQGDTSMEDAFENGTIEFELKGEKLKGAFVLVKTKNKNWLLIKKKDKGADKRRKPLKTEPKSVLSNKTIEDINKEMN